MIKVTRRTRLGGHPISLRFDEPTLQDIGKAVSGGILDNIRSQRQADGQPLQQNAPSTREAKRKLGLPVLALVFKQHRFVKGNGMSWFGKPDVQGNRVTVRPSSAELANLSRSLQQRGYVGFFGVSDKARAAIRARVRKFIREAIAKATGRVRK
jgi:hypothetical protein